MTANILFNRLLLPGNLLGFHRIHHSLFGLLLNLCRCLLQLLSIPTLILPLLGIKTILNRLKLGLTLPLGLRLVESPFLCLLRLVAILLVRRRCLADRDRRLILQLLFETMFRRSTHLIAIVRLGILQGGVHHSIHQYRH